MSKMTKEERAARMREAANRVQAGENICVVMFELGFVCRGCLDNAIWSEAFENKPGMFGEPDIWPDQSLIRSTLWGELNRRYEKMREAGSADASSDS